MTNLEKLSQTVSPITLCGACENYGFTQLGVHDTFQCVASDLDSLDSYLLVKKNREFSDMVLQQLIIESNNKSLVNEDSSFFCCNKVDENKQCNKNFNNLIIYTGSQKTSELCNSDTILYDSITLLSNNKGNTKVFQPALSNPACIAFRKDTLNKAIFRGMKKFYKCMFRPPFYYKDCKSHKIYLKIIAHIEVVLLMNGLRSPRRSPFEFPLDECHEQDNFQQSSLSDIILWMVCTKNQNKQLNAFRSMSESTMLLASLMKNYSHSKVTKVLQNGDLKFLFDYFHEHGRDSFLAQFSGIKQNKCREALDALISLP